MQRVQVFLALLVATTATVAILAVPAGAAGSPTDKKVAALTKQVAALSKQVTALNKTVVALKKTDKTLDTEINVIAAYAACGIAVSADAISGTWGVIDQMSAALQAGKTYFGTQPVLSDSDTCSLFQVTRSQAVPPTLAAFQAVLNVLAAPRLALAALAPFAR